MALKDTFELSKRAFNYPNALTGHQCCVWQLNRTLPTATLQFINYWIRYYGRLVSDTHAASETGYVAQPAAFQIRVQPGKKVTGKERDDGIDILGPPADTGLRQRQENAARKAAHVIVGSPLLPSLSP
jgi:hypothetical protein